MRAMIKFLRGPDPLRLRKDDDLASKLNYRYSVSLMLVLAVVVSTNQFVGNRITCWVPKHFNGAWTKYTNNYCWVKNTYYLPYEDEIPKEHEVEKREQGTLSYYQWVPLMLLGQAFLFFLPAALWWNLNSRAGMDVHSVVNSSLVFHQAEKQDERDTVLKHITVIFHRFLTSRADKNHGCNLSLTYITKFLCRTCGRRHGNYLISLYLFIKLLYIVNVIGQLFMLDSMLGTDFHFYGFNALSAWWSGSDLAESNRFPRVTMCDFKVRFVGNVQRYTVQCVLPINLFHEYVYLIIWFWMVFVAAVNVYSFLTWAANNMWRIDRHRFVKRHLRLDVRRDCKRDKPDRTKLIKFVDQYLGSDGVFVLRLCLENTDTITVADIVGELWDHKKKLDDAEKEADNPDKPKMNLPPIGTTSV